MLGGEPHAGDGLLGSLLRDVIAKVSETRVGRRGGGVDPSG